MDDFISEDDSHTFGGFLKFQGVDPTTLTPKESELWQVGIISPWIAAFEPGCREMTGALRTAAGAVPAESCCVKKSK